MKKRIAPRRLVVVPASSLASVVGGDGDSSKPKSTTQKQHDLVLAFIKS